MWASHRDFQTTVDAIARKQLHKQGIQKLRDFLDQLRIPLRRLNKDKYVDLYKQQAYLREKLARI